MVDAGTLRALPKEAELFEPVEVSELHGDEEADGVVLVTWVFAEAPQLAAPRCGSSIRGQMVMRWNQGTGADSGGFWLVNLTFYQV
jgi:hypothetical protein